MKKKWHSQSSSSALALSLALAVFVPGSALLAEPLPVADLARTDPVNYATEVYPFLKANCLACHNSTKAKADLILESPREMIKGGESGPAIEPGDGENSFLFTTAAHIEEPTMPPTNNKSKAKNLSPEQLALLKLWIDQGAVGDAVATAAPESWTILQGPQPIYTSALSDSGRFAAVGRGQEIHLYDLRLGNLVASLTDPSLEHEVAHRDLVHSVAFSSDGTLASGGYRIAKIWKRSDASAGAVFSLPNEPTAVTVSPDGKRAAVGVQDGGILLMALDQPEAPPVTIKDHQKAVTGLVFSPDGATLYSVSEDQTARSRSLADPTQGKSQPLPAPANGIALINDGKHLVTTGNDQAIRILAADLASMPPLEYKPHAHPLVGIAAGPNATEAFAAFADGTTIHFKVDPAKPTAPPTEIRRLAHGAPINQFAISLHHPAGPRLATSGPTGAVKLWNATDGTILAELKGDPSIAPRIEALNRDVTIAKRLKAHWDKKIPEAEKLWKAESEKSREAGELIAKARRDADAKRRDLAALEKKTSPAASEEELTKAREAVTVANRALSGSIRNRDLSTRLAGDAFADQTAAESASQEAESLVAALTAEIEAQQKLIPEAEKSTASLALAFSPDGHTLAQALKSGSVRLWSAEKGIWLEDFSAGDGIHSLAFTRDGQLLAANQGRNLLVWSLPGRNWTLARSLGDGVQPDPFVDRVTALAFSPDSSRLLTGSGVPSRAGAILSWKTDDWTLANRLDEAHRDTLTSFAFSPDGNRFASASTDRLIKVFDTETFEFEKTFEGHTSHVLDVDWNSDGLTLASSGADLQVKTWDIEAGQQKAKFEGFQKEIGSVVFVGATENLLTASGDKTLKLANQPLPDAGDTFLHTAACSADGNLIIAGGQDGVLRLWDGSSKKILKTFPSPQAESAKVASESASVR